MALISKLENIANEIRNKTGKSDLLTLDEMASEIAAIEVGGGGGELPEDAYKITGASQYRFAYGNWDWFIDLYGKKLTSEGMTSIKYMFDSSKLESIPFVINMATNCKEMNYAFTSMKNLKEAPSIRGELSAPTGNYSGTLDIGSLFAGCNSLRYIPEDYFHNFGGEAFWEASKLYRGGRSYIFDSCYSLRNVPDISMLVTTDTSPYAILYYDTFSGCYALDEILDMPVMPMSFTSNGFYYTFRNCQRIKELKFKTNEDGTPIATTWKNQIIDLTEYVGYATRMDYATRYNSGITEDKYVNSDATYQALKNDPDWFSANVAYSRYNHDSAVNTINSLPDVSSGSGNTIKFKGDSGSATDGGAINTLTEEEIAVAAAKGWTVTLV